MNGAGTLAQHFHQLFDAPLADSSWAERRVRLPWQVFAKLIQRAFCARGVSRRPHPEAFWRGWRLRWPWTAPVQSDRHAHNNGALKKATSRRGRAAFAKLTTERAGGNRLAQSAGGGAGTAEPVGVGIGAQALLSHLPKGALLLADRLYGLRRLCRRGAEGLQAGRPATS